MKHLTKKQLRRILKVCDAVDVDNLSFGVIDTARFTDDLHLNVLHLYRGRTGEDMFFSAAVLLAATIENDTTLLLPDGCRLKFYRTDLIKLLNETN